MYRDVSVETTTLVDELEAEYEASLRAVATYDRDDYEVHYLRDDAETNYSLADMEEIYREVVLAEINQPFHEKLFDDMGDIRGRLRLFDGGTVAHFWPTDDDRGAFVAFDDRADPGVRSLLRLVGDHYD